MSKQTTRTEVKGVKRKPTFEDTQKSTLTWEGAVYRSIELELALDRLESFVMDHIDGIKSGAKYDELKCWRDLLKELEDWGV